MKVVKHEYVLFLATLLLLVFEAATVSPRSPAACAQTLNGKCSVNTAAFALDSERKHISIRPSLGVHISKFVAAATNSHDSSGDKTQPRQMVMFRAPSRHTYGFVRNANYDLPAVELRTLSSSMNENHDIQFIPLESSSQLSENNMEQSRSRKDEEPKPKSKNQSKKKGAKYTPHIPLLYWIECENEISADDISNAARRAILTHATFSINESICFSEEEWKGATSNYSCTVSHVCKEILDQLDVIDMSNPNISRDDRTQLIERVSCLIEQQNPELKLRLDMHNQLHGEHILIHHIITPMQQQPQNKEPSGKLEQNSIHYLYFGYRTSIGPAGTRGAPSQTLRRTHRGLLKQYALKNRRVANANVAYVTSTAMEPEIGFLMANLALAGIDQKGSRVLDPCCGSGRLLLYAAALGASTLVGVDSDPSVWKDAESEFQRHLSAIDCRSSLAVPKFFRGDVQNPSSTKALCTPNSVDAIVCDPPYNIGAPVLVDGGKDIRPRNYHDKNDERGHESSSEINKSSEIPTDLDLVPSILAIARRILVNGGKIVFFIPIRGEEMSMSLEELMLSRGCYQLEKDLESDSLHLLESSTILQNFSPTFSRWLVCMEKRLI
mmetsp:Transcript_20137/g.43739  ORF Transcript_20137/g.43739 Transcript_20137/m.43739 type:complete len:609 (+) Transcript_20137:87-1913(+)